jgi:hypothetical protein
MHATSMPLGCPCFLPGVTINHVAPLKAPTGAVAVSRGPLVFALHPTENKTIVRNYTTTPSTAGKHAPDYLISTPDTWNYALDLDAGTAFDKTPSTKWHSSFAFDDSGEYPFSINVTARQVSSWGYWKGSKITNPPPASPVSKDVCGAPTILRLVPFGSTNIRISVFPHTTPAAAALLSDD